MGYYRQIGNEHEVSTELSNVTRVYIEKGCVRTAFLHLPDLTQIKGIEIIQSEIDWELLSQCKNLRTIYFQRINFSIESSALLHLKKLNSLSIENCKLNTLPDFVCSLNSLEYLSLKNNTLTSLPSAFENIPLLNLQIENNSLTTFPKCICNIHSLENICIGNNEIEEFPEEIGQLINLSSLYANHNALKRLPESLHQLKNLETIHLDSNNLTTIPKAITGLPKLSHLNVDRNQIHQIQGSFRSEKFRLLSFSGNHLKEICSSLIHVNEIDYLHLDSNELKQFPKKLQNDIKIYSLNINNNPIFSFSALKDVKGLQYFRGLLNHTSEVLHSIIGVKELQLDDLFYLDFSQEKRNQFEKFLACLGRAKIDFESKCWFFDQFYPNKSFKTFEEVTKQQIIKGLAIPFKPLQTIMLQKLTEYEEKENGIQDLKAGKSSLAVLGKLGWTRTELKNKLEELDIHYESNPNKKISHLLIGKLPNDVTKINTNITAKLITESSLLDYFNSISPSCFVKKEQDKDSVLTDLLEKITQLLHSSDQKNVLIAIEMLKNNGVPKSFIPELFFLQKVKSEPKVRSEIRKLLLTCAPGELLPAINDRIGINIEKLKEAEITQKLKKAEKIWGEEICFNFSLKAFERFGKGLRYTILSNSTDEKIVKKIGTLCCQNEILNWTKAYGYKDYRNFPLEEQISYGGFNRLKLPLYLLEYHSIKHMILHNLHTNTLPATISKFEELEELDCSLNLLKQLPKSIGKLKKLKRINLANNRFEEFPKELLLLTQIERIDLRNNLKLEDGKEIPVSLTEEVLQQLPNCEILV